MLFIFTLPQVQFYWICHYLFPNCASTYFISVYTALKISEPWFRLMSARTLPLQAAKISCRLFLEWQHHKTTLLFYIFWYSVMNHLKIKLIMKYLYFMSYVGMMPSSIDAGQVKFSFWKLLHSEKQIEMDILAWSNFTRSTRLFCNSRSVCMFVCAVIANIDAG